MSDPIQISKGPITSKAFWDPNRLQNIKSNSDDPKALREAAKEFSSLMFQMMIKSMRDAQSSLKSDLFGGDAYKQYEEMMDQQWAVHISQTDNNSIVEAVLKQLTKNTSQALDQPQQQPKISQDNVTTNISKINNVLDPTLLKINKSVNNSVYKPSVVQPSNNSTIPVDKKFNGPKDFVQKLMPAAIAAAQKIGLDPKLLLAQAALETGWGSKIAQLPNGESSHNLFGIKAQDNWQGSKVVTNTTEFEDGVLTRKSAKFRAYPDFAASMHDYVKLIGGATRYQSSKDNVSSPEGYTKALQDSGYATDPNYAQKIMRIYKEI